MFLMRPAVVLGPFGNTLLGVLRSVKNKAEGNTSFHKEIENMSNSHTEVPTSNLGILVKPDSESQDGSHSGRSLPSYRLHD